MNSKTKSYINRMTAKQLKGVTNNITSRSKRINELASKNFDSISNKLPNVTKKFTPVSKKITEKINLISKKEPSNDSKIMTYAIGFFVLTLLGINLILYLGIYTEALADYFRPIFKTIAGFFGYTLAEGTKKTTETSAKGATVAVDVIADTTKGVVDIGKDATINTVNLAQDLSDFDKLKLQLKHNKKEYETPEPDDLDSEIQNNNPTKKAGYCLVGKSQGIRTCMKVTDKDICMSGEIFPSKQLCINPALRE